jgi:hypothetical protein
MKCSACFEKCNLSKIIRCHIASCKSSKCSSQHNATFYKIENFYLTVAQSHRWLSRPIKGRVRFFCDFSFSLAHYVRSAISRFEKKAVRKFERNRQLWHPPCVSPGVLAVLFVQILREGMA